MRLRILLLFGGLALQVAGTFALSFGAFGADRLSKWRESFVRIGKVTTTKDLAYHIVLAIVLFGMVATLALTPVIWLTEFLGPQIDKLGVGTWRYWGAIILWAIIWITLGAFGGVGLYRLTSALFRTLGSGLATLDIWARIGKVGLYGFLMLVVGLILQFFGSLI